MRNRKDRVETKEEYEARRGHKEEEESKRKEDTKQLVKNLIKVNECPECHKAQLKKFKRKNYTHGKKSKPTITTGKRCPQCNYMRLDKK